MKLANAAGNLKTEYNVTYNCGIQKEIFEEKKKKKNCKIQLKHTQHIYELSILVKDLPPFGRSFSLGLFLARISLPNVTKSNSQSCFSG